MSPPASVGKNKNLVKRQPCTPPPFTLADLKAKIPAHCFVRSTFTSTLYLIADLIGVAVLYYCSLWIEAFPTYFAAILWPTYWILQGGVCTGLWVVAHECGHRAYSDSVFVCDVVGWVLHSFLLVPYHSWRISHGKHHRSTGDIDRDEAFVPKKRSKILAKGQALPPTEQDHPFALLIELVGIFTVGWFVYLATHTTGRDYGKQTNHFTPGSPLFNKKQFWQVVASDIGIVAMLALAGYYAYLTSVVDLVFHYVIPVLIVNFWLLLYTYLHHTDIAVPHYRSEDWTWLIGALSTVDRDYGFLWNTLHHNIGDTHVLHHLFSKIPHYHAKEATEAIKPILGEYYNFTDESFWVSLWHTRKNCRFIDDSTNEPALWFA